MNRFYWGFVFCISACSVLVLKAEIPVVLSTFVGGFLIFCCPGNARAFPGALRISGDGQDEGQLSGFQWAHKILGEKKASMKLSSAKVLWKKYLPSSFLFLFFLLLLSPVSVSRQQKRTHKAVFQLWFHTLRGKDIQYNMSLCWINDNGYNCWKLIVINHIFGPISLATAKISKTPLRPISNSLYKKFWEKKRSNAIDIYQSSKGYKAISKATVSLDHRYS